MKWTYYADDTEHILIRENETDIQYINEKYKTWRIATELILNAMVCIPPRVLLVTAEEAAKIAAKLGVKL